LPYDFPGYAQLPTDRFDGLALLKKRAADLCNRLHDQHPNLGFLESWKPMWTLCSGVPIGSRSPRKGGPFCMPIHRPFCIAHSLDMFLAAHEGRETELGGMCATLCGQAAQQRILHYSRWRKVAEEMFTGGDGSVPAD